MTTFESLHSKHGRHDNADLINEAMHNHRGNQAPAPEVNERECQAHNADRNYAGGPFVAMADGEDKGRKHNEKQKD